MERRAFLGSGGAAVLGLALSPTSALARRTRRAAAGSPDAALSARLDAIFADYVKRSPELATNLGLDKGANAPLKSELADISRRGALADLAANRRWLAEVQAFPATGLSQAGRLNREVVAYLLNQNVENAGRFNLVTPGSPYTLSQLTGAYQNVPDFLDSQHTVETRADADAYLARLTAFARQLDQNTASQREDAARGIVAPDFALDLALEQMAALRGKPARKTVLVESLVRRTREKGIAGDWGARAERIVTAQVFPAMDRQIALVRQLRTRASHDAGIWRLPQGPAMYAAAVRTATTTDYTPEQVHQLGLTQVADIGGRLDAILKSQGFTRGSVGERLSQLNKDPRQLYPNTDAGREALLAQLNAQIAAMTTRLPQAFATLPKAALTIKRVPPFIEAGAPNGYYNSAALDGSRPAIYYINLKDTADWPKYSLPSLTFHEGVPGHHLQGSLAQEAVGVPMLRKVSFLSAYGEGWALYAEQLADELGMYENDPLGRAGFLQSLLFRAARLVVDTGIHSKRWSREKATDYMVATTGFARPRTQREIDRYCVWPGQATSYKVGHTAWLRARDRAKAIQGARFDLRQFHQVLLEGSVPLTILERLVEERARAAA